MAGFLWWKSVPIHVQQEFCFPVAGAVRHGSSELSSAVSEPAESQRRETDRRELAAEGELSWIQHDSLPESAGVTSVAVHPRQLTRGATRIDCAGSMFDNREFNSATRADAGESESGSLLQLNRESR